MSTWLVNVLPTWLLGVIVIGGTILLTVVVARLLRKYVSSVHTEEHNEIVGFIFATVGVVYAVLLALVVFSVWESYAAAEQATAREAGTAIAIYRDTRMFPPATQSAIQRRLRTYVTVVLDDEWRTMAYGNPSPRALSALGALYNEYDALKPTSPWQVVTHQEALSRLGDLSTERSLRILSSKAALPGIFWIVLVFGAIITLACAVLLYVENASVHLVLCGLLAALISSLLFLILALDRPFSGDVHIPKDSFEYAAQIMKIPKTAHDEALRPLPMR
jgi:hypothetical protein